MGASRHPSAFAGALVEGPRVDYSARATLIENSETRQMYFRRAGRLFSIVAGNLLKGLAHEIPIHG